MRAACAASLLLLFTACRPAPPKTLAFPVTLVGERSVLPVPETLRAAFPQGSWLAEPPFRVQFDAGNQPTGIAFEPTRPGPVTATLHVNDERFSDSLTLTGIGRALPVPGNVCEIDASDGTVTWKPDRTPCRVPCIPDGQCWNGRCTGPREACDDGVACTRDTCDEALGCVHTADDLACTEVGDDCHWPPTCDPLGGCVRKPRDDGTPCGPWWCGEMNQCSAGTCVDTALTDACALPAVAHVGPAWTADLARAVCSDAGECLGLGDRGLTALDFDGHTRFTQPPYFDRAARTQYVLMRVGDVVLAGRRWADDQQPETQLGLEARSWTDGSLRWAWTASHLIGTSVVQAYAAPFMGVDADTVLVKGRSVADTDTGFADTFFTIRTDTGEVVGREKPFMHRDYDASDGMGTLLARENMLWNYETGVEGVTGAFANRWKDVFADAFDWIEPVPLPPGAIHNGERFVVPGVGLVDPATGATTILHVPSGVTLASPERMWWWSGGGRASYDGPPQTCHPIRVGSSSLVGSGDASSCTLWGGANPEAFVLTDRGTMLALVDDYSPRIPVLLLEVAPDATIRHAYALDSHSPFEATSFTIIGLARGRLFLQTPSGVSAYDLPEPLEAAPHGWITKNGDLARTRTPR